jgi:hypothetical protein
MEKILEALKKLSGWVTGGIGFLVTLIAAIILLRGNLQLTIVLLIAIVEIAGLVVYIFSWKEKNPPQIMEISLPKYPKLRRFGWIALLIMLLLDLWFFTSPLGKEIVNVAINGAPTSIATDIEPMFEINFIGLPYKTDEAYYVTNNMIVRNDLSGFDDFSLEPLAVEIVPHYSGNDKFGNVLLRISGEGGKKEVNLWSDFDKDGQSQTISLTFAEIIQLGGIKASWREIDTNLMLPEMPYQSARLNFEIVRLAEPDQPFTTKELPIKNMPWVQNAEMNYGNGIAVDYSLNNLGTDAKFHCILNIAKVVDHVNADSHSFWGGTQVFHYGPNCDSFDLKTGETYKTSLLLNKETMGEDFTRGRYVVQIYTFAERGDVKFNNNLTYDTSSGIWMFANPGNVLTFVICNDPEKSCDDSVTLPIEEGNVHVFPYSSMEQTQNGQTWLHIKTYVKDGHAASRYILDYQIDPQNPNWSWAAFAMVFEKPIDLSDFKSIKMNFKFDDANAPVMIKITSTTNGVDTWKDIKLGDGVYGNNNTDYQTIVVPFSAFDSIDWTSVKAVDFVADTGSAPDANHHQFEVSEIEFIK